MNYKIRVESEAESKEVQCLFFDLGYGFEGNEIKEIQEFEYTGVFYLFAYGDDCDLTHSSDRELFNSKPHKEITLPELSDLVVLNRNDVGDATHENIATGSKVLQMGNKNYYWQDGKWNEYPCGVDIKPIEKKEMREYLIPSDNYKYIEAYPITAWKEWIEIPEGAEKATFCGGFLIFWKDEFLSYSTHDYLDWKSSKEHPESYYSFTEYTKKYDDAVIIWSRETLNDQVASAETARQSDKVLKEILEGNLPEFDFEAIDAFIESNVEQGQKHSHYKKDVSHLNMIDIYRVTEMFKPHSCGAHIAKKALCSGQRGHKDLLTDIQDIIDTAERWKEMLIEDENSCKD